MLKITRGHSLDTPKILTPITELLKSCDKLSLAHPELFKTTYSELVQYSFPLLLNCFRKEVQNQPNGLQALYSSDLSQYLSACMHYYYDFK